MSSVAEVAYMFHPSLAPPLTGLLPLPPASVDEVKFEAIGRLILRLDAPVAVVSTPINPPTNTMFPTRT